jgi:3-hydroxyisobutyrate dehydrogenase
MTSGKPAVGFVGVGRMGANMALRLHDRGYRIAAVYDVRREAAGQTAEATGASIAESLAAVTNAAEIVFTVVSDDAAMDRIFAESGDSLLVGARGKLFVNCATLTPEVHRTVERRARSAGAQSIEACMASSIPQAREGTLFLMLAGDESAYHRVEPILREMSASLVYVGQSGRAAEIKAIVNVVMNVNTAGLAEGLGLGAALGIDLDQLRDILSKTGANSRVLETDGADMANRDHAVFFSAAHAAKDSDIALALATAVGLDLPLARATAAQFHRLVEVGDGELDKSAIAELTFKDRKGGR